MIGAKYSERLRLFEDQVRLGRGRAHLQNPFLSVHVAAEI
jgi:hypothetical protein